MPMSAQRRRFNKLFSRENLADFARTMAWVAPLTLLIWIYAEREQIATVSDVSVQIQVQANGPRQVATVIRPGDRNVVITMEGPRVRLDFLRTQFATDANQSLLVIELPPELPVGPVTRSIVDELNRLPLFRANGVKVTAASPAQITVDVDELVTRELFVMADPAAGNFDGVPVFDPPSVKLTGPRAILDRFSDEDAAGRPAVRAAMQTLVEVRTPGDHINVEVGLTRPALINDAPDPDQFNLAPDRVRATFRIRQADVSFTIPAVPIFPLAALTLLDDYRPVFEPTVTNVTVFGPPDLIAALRNDTLARKPRAILELTRDDLPAGRPRTRRLRFDLPEGLTISPEDSRREVEFTLVPRTRPE